MRIVTGFAASLAAGVALGGSAHADYAAVLAAPAPAAVGRVTPVEARLAPDFRLRLAVLSTSETLDPLQDPDGTMKHRFASSMIDYYPIHGSGLHLSGGMKFFSVANFVRDAEKATGGLLYAPRLPGGNSGVRTGFNRRTPAATVGYSGTYHNAMFGVEMGTLIGAANANLPRSYRALGDRPGGLNPIANLMVGLKF
ncbi:MULTISPECIES: hypothetical protein [unclassified Sphingomonas]|uniref:hypothetical protein n=1 Tax=unclassified Sphingomonas TaxID=196159 RepID=UPI001F5977FC|nr:MULTISPECIES: hypothetical protein [unclassified Sphingomonas]